MLPNLKGTTLVVVVGLPASRESSKSPRIAKSKQQFNQIETKRSSQEYGARLVQLLHPGDQGRVAFPRCQHAERLDDPTDTASSSLSLTFTRVQMSLGEAFIRIEAGGSRR